MSLSTVKSLFTALNQGDSWSLQLIKIKNSRKTGTNYIARELVLEPAGTLKQFIRTLSEKYTDDKSGELDRFENISEYDGSAIGTTIYKLSCNSDLIKTECEYLSNAIANPDVEVNPFDLRAQAYVILGDIEIEGKSKCVKLFSIQNPIITLRNKFFLGSNGTFQEYNKKVLSLKSSIDVVIIDDCVYMLTLSGEKLFNMERAYKHICAEKVEEIKDSDILADPEVFCSVANSGHNPRKFVAYKQSRLSKLKEATCRIEMANKFGIPLIGDKFDTSQKGASDKVVKLLCNKGMIDPFEDCPVEVAGAKNWT